MIIAGGWRISRLLGTNLDTNRLPDEEVYLRRVEGETVARSLLLPLGMVSEEVTFVGVSFHSLNMCDTIANRTSTSICDFVFSVDIILS